MATQVRIALIGNSHAEAVQLPTLAHIGGNEVIGIAGHNAQKAAASAKRWGIERSTSDWRELLELEPDLVIVATPVDLHFEREALHTRCSAGGKTRPARPGAPGPDQLPDALESQPPQDALVVPGRLCRRRAPRPR